MKRTDLKAIEGMTDEMISSIMALHQNDCEDWNAKIKDRDDSISELNKKLKTFEGVDVEQLKKDLSEWQEKYNHDLLQKDKDYAKRDLFNGYHFSSKLSRKAAEAEFDSKNFEFKDGEFNGAKDFFEELKKSDPDAFKGAEEHEDKPGASGLDLGRGGKTPKMDGVEAAFYAMNPDLKK